MNPLEEFIKYAERKTKVKSHVRRTGSKLSLVDSHSRELSEREIAVQKEIKLRKKQAEELQLWTTWNEGGRKKKDLKPLLDSFRPLINARASIYTRDVRIPRAAVEAEFTLKFVDALKNYNPERGSLGTYVYKYLDKAKRFIVENQNIARIPENRAYKISEFKTASDEFMQDTGRPPDLEELSKKLGWSLAETDRMDRELRKDMLNTEFVDDPYSFTPSKDEELIRLFKYELAGKERELYEYLTGMGKPRISSTGELAKKMGMKDYQISRMKASINKKMSKYV